MTNEQITDGIQNSLLSDSVNEMCLSIHKENPGFFKTAINSFEKSMEEIINENDEDVYEVFVSLKEIEIIRVGNNSKLNKIIISMCGSLSKYKQDIIVGDLLSQVKIGVPNP